MVNWQLGFKAGCPDCLEDFPFDGIQGCHRTRPKAR